MQQGCGKNRQITRHAMKLTTSLSMCLNTLCEIVFSFIPAALVFSGNSVFCSLATERWIAVWSEWVCSGQLQPSTVELCVWDLLWMHSYSQYSESFYATPRAKACCQATRHRKHPQMIYLISTAKPVQQLCPLYWFTLLLELKHAANLSCRATPANLWVSTELACGSSPIS